MHQIAKINHCETSILGGKGIAVKLAERVGAEIHFNVFWVTCASEALLRYSKR